MKTIRVLIVDDEWLARRELRILLGAFADVEVVGEAADVDSAVKAIAALAPTLVLLDIQMPGESGFEIIERVEAVPPVIFVTAHDEHAIRAFEVNALDYLLKPVHPDRLAASLERVRALSADMTDPTATAAPSSGERPLTLADSLLVKSGLRMRFLRIGMINCIRAAGDYTEVTIAGRERLLVSMRMKAWEARLPAKTFCRIHRSTIVRMDRVVAINDIPGGGSTVVVEGVDEPLVLSRRMKSRLRGRLK